MDRRTLAARRRKAQELSPKPLKLLTTSPDQWENLSPAQRIQCAIGTAKFSNARYLEPLTAGPEPDLLPKDPKLVSQQRNPHKIGILSPATGKPHVIDLTLAPLFQERLSPIQKNSTFTQRHHSQIHELPQLMPSPRRTLLPSPPDEIIGDDNLIIVNHCRSRKRSLVPGEYANRGGKHVLPSLGQFASSKVLQLQSSLRSDEYRESSKSVFQEPLKTQPNESKLTFEHQEDQKIIMFSNPQSAECLSPKRTRQRKKAQIKKMVMQRQMEVAESFIKVQTGGREVFDMGTLSNISHENSSQESQEKEEFEREEPSETQLPPVVENLVPSPMNLKLPWDSERNQRPTQVIEDNIKSILKKPTVIKDNVFFGNVTPEMDEEPEPEYSDNAFLAAIQRLFNKSKRLAKQADFGKTVTIQDQRLINGSFKNGIQTHFKTKSSFASQQSFSPDKFSNRSSGSKKLSIMDKMKHAMKEKLDGATDLKSAFKDVKMHDAEVYVDQIHDETRTYLDEKYAEDSDKSLFSDHPSAYETKAKFERKMQRRRKHRRQFNNVLKQVMKMNLVGGKIKKYEKPPEFKKDEECDKCESSGNEDESEEETREVCYFDNNVHRKNLREAENSKEKDKKDQNALLGKAYVNAMDKTLRALAVQKIQKSKVTDNDNDSQQSNRKKKGENNVKIGIRRKLKEGIIQHKMLQSGNSELFHQERNKNCREKNKKKVTEIFVENQRQQAMFCAVSKNLGTLAQSELWCDDSRVKFFLTCSEDNQPIVPLLSKIIERSLILKNFTLQLGQCKAIAEYLQTDRNGLQKLQLSNNGLDAQSVGLVLEGLKEQQFFKSLVIHENEVDEDCVTHIDDLVMKKMPENLEMLRLSHCKINWKTTQMLLETFTSRCYLKKLELVKANLNEFSVPILGEVIKTARQITSLDISWNSIVPDNMKYLLEILAKNRRIQYLNLSWNILVKQTATKKEQEEILGMLGRLIKFNPKFIHFDLTSTGLNKFLIFELGKMLKRSRSLLAIHLSENPGLSEENVQYLRKRIVARPNENIGRFNRINNTVKDLLKDRPGDLIDVLYTKQQRAMEHNTDEFKPAEKLIFQRQLGFKEEVPGAGQWYQSSNVVVPNAHHYKHSCWVCEGHVFSIVFWTRKMAQRLSPIFTSNSGDGAEAEKIGLEIDKFPGSHFVSEPSAESQTGLEMDYDESEKNVDAGLGHVNGSLPYDDLDDQVPYISGSFSGWRYKKMLPVHELCKRMDKDFTDNFELCQNIGKIRKRICNIEDATKKEKKDYLNIRLRQALNYSYGNEDQSSTGWPHFFKQLKYKKPFVVNGYELNELFHEEQALKKERKGVIDSDDDYKAELQEQALSSDEEQVYAARREKRQIRDQQVKDRLELRRKRKMARAAGEIVPESSGSEIDPVSLEKQDEYVKETEQLFALPMFLKPGKHHYFIKYKDSKERSQRRALKRRAQKQFAEDVVKPELFFYQAQVTKREEDVPDFAKKTTSNVVVREYHKDSSVFKAWIKDDPNNVHRIAEEDFKYWKVNGMIKEKEQDDREGVQQVIRDNYKRLKDIFINIASKSQYPCIGQLDFGYFVTKSQIHDKNVNISAVDRAFIATNYKPKDGPEIPNNPGNALSRFEFMEIIVRLAREKYLMPQLEKNLTASLKRLLTECIFANYSCEPWQEFRDAELYNMDVNDLLEANLSGLETMYRSYFTQIKKFLELHDCVHMMQKCENLQISEDDVKFAFGMSKMTVFNEIQHHMLYRNMKFVEFLEFLCRMAHLKFKGNTDLTLVQKLEFLLDELFAAYNMQRHDVNIEVEEISESDDEY